ncbi:MAG: hypothetical protein JST80_12185 [Bdellovibrionales bacterium]|nr:hypothetical protein [Bdellovibrionales bacterium]
MQLMLVLFLFLSPKSGWAGVYHQDARTPEQVLDRFVEDGRDCPYTLSDPCDRERFAVYPPEKLVEEISHYAVAKKGHLITAETYDELVDSKKEMIALPDRKVEPEIQTAVERLMKCGPLKGSDIQVMMGDDSRSGPNAFSDSYRNRILFGKTIYKIYRKFGLSRKKLDSLIGFVIAHEYGHFIVDTYARDAADHRSAGGNRAGIEIYKDIKNKNGKDGLSTEGEVYHDEVDAVAAQLLARCGLPVPELDLLIRGLGGNPQEFSYCQGARRRALNIRKNMEQDAALGR